MTRTERMAGIISHSSTITIALASVLIGGSYLFGGWTARITSNEADIRSINVAISRISVAVESNSTTIARITSILEMQAKMIDELRRVQKQ